MWKTKAINRELPPGAGKQRRQRREEGMAMLFLLPSLLGLVLLSLIPMLISLYISLTDWVYTDGLGNWNFVGFQNFIDLWKDSWFQKSLWNTVIFTIVTVPLTIILALVIAALIDNFCADRTAGVVRIALYMPHICNIYHLENDVFHLWSFYKSDAGTGLERSAKVPGKLYLGTAGDHAGCYLGEDWIFRIFVWGSHAVTAFRSVRMCISGWRKRIPEVPETDDSTSGKYYFFYHYYKYYQQLPGIWLYQCHDRRRSEGFHLRAGILYL